MIWFDLKCISNKSISPPSPFWLSFPGPGIKKKHLFFRFEHISFGVSTFSLLCSMHIADAQPSPEKNFNCVHDYLEVNPFHVSFSLGQLKSISFLNLHQLFQLYFKVKKYICKKIYLLSWTLSSRLLVCETWLDLEKAFDIPIKYDKCYWYYLRCNYWFSLHGGGGKPSHISSLINLKRNKKFPTRTEDEGGADPDLALALALSLSVQQPSQVGLFFCLSWWMGFSRFLFFMCCNVRLIVLVILYILVDRVAGWLVG